MAKKMLNKPAAPKAAARRGAVKKSYTAEENLKRLAKSGLLDEFIERTGCCWDHQCWLDLCAEVNRGEPLGFDQVGLMLEGKKAEAISGCSCCCD